MEFEDRTVLITGGGSGIGRETAIAFAKKGARVVIGDLDEEAGTKVVDTIDEHGGEARFVQADVTESADVKMMVETATSVYGGLDIAFNNAGIEGAIEPTAAYAITDWQRVLEVNLTGVFLCVQQEIPVMIESGGGSIVNAGSVLSSVGMEQTCAYTAAKHGVLGLTRTAALEYADDDIRVNAVCPAFIDTPMQDRIGITNTENGRRYLEELHPAGRLGRAREVTQAVLWLASDNASFVTGHGLAVDGGYLSQ